MNTNIEDATIVAEPIKAEELAIAQNVMAIVPEKNYGVNTANAIAEAIIKLPGHGMQRTEVLAIVSCLADALLQAQEAISNDLVQEAQQWPEKKLDVFGVQLTIKETGTKYYYDQDAEWKEIKAKLDVAKKQFGESTKELEAKRKARETYLRETGKAGKYSETGVYSKLL